MRQEVQVVYVTIKLKGLSQRFEESDEGDRQMGFGVVHCCYFFFFLSFISLIADGPHHYHPACAHKGSSHLSPVHFLSRCKFITLTTRQPMVEFYLLTFPRFPLRKKEHKSCFGKNRTHDFRTSRCAAYLLEDHSGDERRICDKIYLQLIDMAGLRLQRAIKSDIQ